jgi:multidrug efflux pump subunit AcrA (membrane-fusion protein)
MNYNKILIIPFFLVLACTPSIKEAAESNKEVIGTPVTLTSPEKGNMKDVVEVNAVSAFLLKSAVKSNSNGYLQVVNATLGKLVNKGDELFVIKTKEANSLGNALIKLDTTFHFDGTIHIKSPGTGYITQINYRIGDYVQDGEALATITDTKSFVFLLDLPYELKSYLPNNHQLELKLPDGTNLQGKLEAPMPMVDAVSQTQNFIIKVNTSISIPENLIAKVALVKKLKINTTSIPKAALLSNDTQTEFWIMKMIDSVTAVRVDVKKGIETNSNVEILSPQLFSKDKLVLTGHYGLADTAKVIVNK